MNVVNGAIRRIFRCDSFNRSEIKVRGKADFIVLTLELNDYFRESAEVSMMFKESDVLLAKGRHWQLSVENRFPCTVTKITAGDIFVELELKTSFVNIRSLVDREAFNRLNVVCGEELNAFVKANEISLMLDTSA